MQCSHVMAMSVQRLFPGTQVTVGPWIEHGFFYDFDTPKPLGKDDLKAIQKDMKKLIRANLPFEREEVGACHRKTHSCLSLAAARSVQAGLCQRGSATSRITDHGPCRLRCGQRWQCIKSML